VTDAIERAKELATRYDAELERLIPAGASIFDVHVHLGHDIDGMAGDYDELEALMARYGISHAFVFCLDEPDRHPSFTAANDRTLAFAALSDGRLIPFARLDLNEEPLAEARRCLDLGARGIKLHPRAQRFDAGDERLEPVFALASERRLPILIHGGRGLPPVAHALASLVDRNPGVRLIIAHAGIADLDALAREMAGRSNVFFDTSTWSAIDLLDFYRRIPPEQVLYASDFPYGQQPSSLLIALRTARLSGYGEEQLRDMLGRTAVRIAEGRELPEPGAPLGIETFRQPMQLARIHSYLSMTMPLLWTRQADSLGMLGLAINACAEQNGSVEATARIADLLTAARELWSSWSELPEDERLPAGRLTVKLVHLADIEAVTAGI